MATWQCKKWIIKKKLKKEKKGMDHIHTFIYNMYINIHIKTQKPKQHLVC